MASKICPYLDIIFLDDFETLWPVSHNETFCGQSGNGDGNHNSKNFINFGPQMPKMRTEICTHSSFFPTTSTLNGKYLRGVTWHR